ncbi:MAG: hypothetical protein LBF41_01450 [Deltaproteobacteria bacterium]|nr:hypothetical protein [Deltaproteobacteria bacterium]
MASTAKKAAFFLLVAAICLCLFTASARAQSEEPPESFDAPIPETDGGESEYELFFASQPPLTREELDLAAELLPILKEAGSDGNRIIEEFSEKKGVSPERTFYVINKVSAGIILAMVPGMGELVAEKFGGAKAALPTPGEQELIEANYDVFKEAFEAMLPF